MKDARKDFREYVKDILTAPRAESAIVIEEQINTIIRMAKKAYEDSDIEDIPVEDVAEVYSAYPTRCVVQGRSLGKSGADKKKIARLLRDKDKGLLIQTIQRYVEECKRDKVYMKNFGTFLNNLPEYDFTEKPKTVDIGGYRDLRKITEAQ